MFWLTLLLFVVSTVIAELLAPKTKNVAGALGDFNFPTAQEGRCIPYVLGTCKIGGGNTVWWGDLRIAPIKKRASFLSFSSSIVGYKYYIGVQYCLCWGSPDLILIGIQANKIALPYTTTTIYNGNGSEDRQSLYVTGDNIFGGTDVGGEGGVAGYMDFYRGLPTQQPNAYLSLKQGRVAIDQSTGLGYVYAGEGNGTLGFLSGGAASLNETITITAEAFIADDTSPYYFKEKFSVIGSVSGNLGPAYADFAFSVPQINFTIATGSIRFVDGDKFTIQTSHSHLAPAYPGICYAVLNQLYVGTEPYPKPFDFIVQRCPDPFGQGPSIANIGGDGNGVLAIYELMTNTLYGLGVTPTKFNAASFQAAAVTVAAEGLGISFQQDTFETADSIIGEILRHLDGVIYVDAATGLWNIKLARADYDPTAIPVLDQSCVESFDYARGSWEETTNHLIVSYLSRDSDFNVRTVEAYDAANINVSQELRPETVDYKYISNLTTASLVAMRTLAVMAAPLAKLKIIVNRKAWDFRMGNVFLVNWAPLGIVGMVFRVTHIAYGQVADGKITIDAVEDIFGITDVAFVSPPESGWVNPSGSPEAPAQQELFEVPYEMMIDAAVPLGRYALALAARGDPTSKTFQIWISETTVQEAVEFAPFIPAGTLAAAYPANTPALDPVGFTLSNLIDEADLSSGSADDLIAGRELVLIDDEIMAVQTLTDPGTGIVTISNVIRGVMDTVPASHAQGAVAWFISEGAVTTKTVPALADGIVQAQFLPQNNIGVYPIASATALMLTFDSRYLRPYPPGNVRVNGGAYTARPATIAGDLVITWSSRNRLTQAAAATMVQQDAGEITGEEGQFFTVQKFIGGVAVGDLINLGPDESFTYTTAERAADDPDFTKLTTIEIYSNVGALACLFPQVVTTLMVGAAVDLPSPGRYEFAATEVGGLYL
jgi:hypothetical protein